MKTLKKTRSSRAKPITAKSSVARTKQHTYVLRLFVAGATTRSQQAVLRVRELCERSLKGHVSLEVVDIYQQPGLAREHQIVATPTLIILLPSPVRRFIGSLSNLTDLFRLLDLGEKGRIVL